MSSRRTKRWQESLPKLGPSRCSPCHRSQSPHHCCSPWQSQPPHCGSPLQLPTPPQCHLPNVEGSINHLEDQLQQALNRIDKHEGWNNFQYQHSYNQGHTKGFESALALNPQTNMPQRHVIDREETFMEDMQRMSYESHQMGREACQRIIPGAGPSRRRSTSPPWRVSPLPCRLRSPRQALLVLGILSANLR